jgi:hypothetical protein
MARDRKRHARAKEVPTAAPPAAAMPSNVPIAATQNAPHPCLTEIVRLLARHAAKADIAAQRPATSEE